MSTVSLTHFLRAKHFQIHDQTHIPTYFRMSTHTFCKARNVLQAFNGRRAMSERPRKGVIIACRCTCPTTGLCTFPTTGTQSALLLARHARVARQSYQRRAERRLDGGVHMHTRTHALTHSRTHARTHARAATPARTCMRAHTHAHTCLVSRQPYGSACQLESSALCQVHSFPIDEYTMQPLVIGADGRAVPPSMPGIGTIQSLGSVHLSACLPMRACTPVHAFLCPVAVH